MSSKSVRTVFERMMPRYGVSRKRSEGDVRTEMMTMSAPCRPIICKCAAKGRCNNHRQFIAYVFSLTHTMAVLELWGIGHVRRKSSITNELEFRLSSKVSGALVK